MPPSSSDHRPSEITGRVFAVRRKGFDTDEVRAYLGQLAEIVSRLTAERDDARAKVSDLEVAAATRPAIDEDQLTAALGEETASILSSARKAAADMKEKAEVAASGMVSDATEQAATIRRDAEADAERIRGDAQAIRDAVEEARRQSEADMEAETARRLEAADAEATERREAAEAEHAGAAEAAAAVRAEAESDAARIRAEADEMMTTRRAEADKIAADTRSAAEVEAETIRAAAHEAAESIRASADQAQEHARAEGEELVAEAQRVRERMLADLAPRRKAAKVQLEQLEGARENLLESYDVVRRNLDEATEGLRTALPRAKSAAEGARSRAEAEPADTVASLESQITAARAAGLPLVAPDPPGTSRGNPLWGPPDGEPEVVPEVAVDVEATTQELEVVDLAEYRSANGTSTADASSESSGEGVDALFARLKASRDVATDESTGAAGDTAADDARDADAPAVVANGAGGAPGEAGSTTESPSTDTRTDTDTDLDLDTDNDNEIAAAAAVDAGEDAESATGGGDDATEDAIDGATNVDEVIGGDDTSLLDMFERRDGAIEPVESRIARKLKRVLADEQGLVLDGVRRASGTPDLDQILTLSTQIASYAAVVADDLLAAAEEGASFEGAALPASTVVDDLAQELGRTLAGVVRPKVERCFATGEDSDDISDRLRATYREWKTDRLVESTRHLVLGAFGRGQSVVLPADSLVRWTPDPASPACPDCEDDALAGSVRSGETFPTGHTHPPAHPGCRCLVVSERVAAPA